ncbi:hypothetical protein BH10ACI1_BH10ACI1_12600 [soil metagenome]
MWKTNHTQEIESDDELIGLVIYELELDQFGGYADFTNNLFKLVKSGGKQPDLNKTGIGRINFWGKSQFTRKMVFYQKTSYLFCTTTYLCRKTYLKLTKKTSMTKVT